MPRLKEGVQWVGVVWAAGALCTEEEEACRCRWRTLCAEQGGRTAGTFAGAQQRSPWGWKQTQARSSTEVSKVGKAWTMAWLLQPNPRIWDKSLYLSQRGRLSFTCSCSSPKPYSPVQETGWESGHWATLKCQTMGQGSHRWNEEGQEAQGPQSPSPNLLRAFWKTKSSPLQP